MREVVNFLKLRRITLLQGLTFLVRVDRDNEMIEVEIIVKCCRVREISCLGNQLESHGWIFITTVLDQ